MIDSCFNHFVDLIELSKWPKKMRMKLIPLVGKIFHNNYSWKLIDRKAVSNDISRKGEQSLFYGVKNIVLVSFLRMIFIFLAFISVSPVSTFFFFLYILLSTEVQG